MRIKTTLLGRRRSVPDSNPAPSPEPDPENEWSLVGSTSEQIAANSSAGDYATVALPGSVQENDLVLIAVVCDARIDSGFGDAGVRTSGYVEEYQSATSLPGAYLAIKRLGSSPEASVDIYQATGRDQAAVIQVWRGADQTTYLDTAIVSEAASGDTPRHPAITTATDGALLVAVAFLDDDDATVSAVPSGYSNLIEQNTGNVSSSEGATVAMSSKVIETAGVQVEAETSLSAGDSWDGIHVALRLGN